MDETNGTPYSEAKESEILRGLAKQQHLELAIHNRAQGVPAVPPEAMDELQRKLG